MASARAVADYLIIKADADSRRLTPLTLQKLVFYAQAFHLAAFDEPLFSERIEAWKEGPVVPDIYHEFKDHGRTPIDPREARQPAASVEAQWLDEVWQALRGFTGSQLRNMTHSENPWKHAWALRKEEDRCTEEITPASMRDYYFAHYRPGQPGYETMLRLSHEESASEDVAIARSFRAMVCKTATP